MVFAFPFSLEGPAKEWFYSQLDEVVTEWDLLRREFLDNYFTGGLCAADKRLLTTSSGGSLSKNKTAAEAWSLIKDVAEATQHVRVRNNPTKSVVEAPLSESALTKVLGDMTTLLKKIHKEQNTFQSIHAIQAPPQILQLEGPPRVCGLCSSTAHYTDQCHQVQEDYTLAAANNYNNRPPYQSQGQNNHSHGNSSNQGLRDNAQGNNHNQRWNQSNSSSQYDNNHQSYSQQHNNNNYANQNHHNQSYQHSQQNPNNNHRYQMPHQRQQSNQPSSSSTNQNEDAFCSIYQEQERFWAMIEKNEENTRN
ncbi:myb-like protein A [Arachis ipaensis]|uniref:myb-like protein A n=1 Tax=Arachis ipaensis TaxID=130454 RepID=UPI0007AF4222|nr:myb-like protein A [Arachis ipaensis]XP_025664951.1 myb-like protein A [Arachis hypogaea]